MTGAAEGVQVLQEVGAAGQLELVTTLLGVAQRVELHRQIERTGDVKLVLKRSMFTRYTSRNLNNSIHSRRYLVYLYYFISARVYSLLPPSARSFVSERISL